MSILPPHARAARACPAQARPAHVNSRAVAA